MSNKSITYLLGDGKLSLSAIIPAIRECSSKCVLIASRNDSLEGIDKCIMDNQNGDDYSIKFLDDTYDSLTSFLDNLKANEITAGVISCDSKTFVDMVKNGNGGIWFSACREGLFETYIPLMEPHITQPTHILVFDNDATIVDKAKQKCHNSNIHFHKCVIHSVCNAMHYDYTERTVHVNDGYYCLLVLPPEIKHLEKEFKSDILGGRAQFQFTASDETFNYFSTWKLLGINALHTLAAVKAYMLGTSKELSLSEISKMSFASLVPEYEMVDYVMKVFHILYDKYLTPYSEYVQIPRDALVKLTKDFISGLYKRQEIVGRGLDPNHSSFASKLDRHFPLLRSSGDPETITMLDRFLWLLRT